MCASEYPPIKAHDGPLPEPIETLARYLEVGGHTLIEAVFANTFFVDPARVREKTVCFPDRARMSREHYPGLVRGEAATWNGRPVKLGDNSRAQMAWDRYTGELRRGTGYQVAHIWGHPWDPDAFTAGWNIAYMPHWARNLTEDQHPFEPIRDALRQASWDLYFSSDPIVVPPPYVIDPGLRLKDVLGQTPLLLRTRAEGAGSTPNASRDYSAMSTAEMVRTIRHDSRNSWSNLLKATSTLQGLPHEAFGTRNVEAASKSHIRKMVRETGLSLPELHELIENLAGL